ncbi:hypothetical protein [Tersicoccus sp. Bi-70]|uniref:hypothetical protein n=1 Tax=Tersicoccus sp. Bi-70 TaxID=1897634 RepID=UPI000977067A|nr:hypothetical protein [Tersicoccus sp. Bi-70]OMH32361.1 hypothetical protein BGP79_08040 [Tersicoccus sp. Bi-70]
MRRAGLVLAAGVIALAGCAGPVAATGESPAPAASSAAPSPSASPSRAAPSSAAASSAAAAPSTADTGHTATGTTPPAKISMICSDKEVLARITALAGASAVAGRTSTWEDGLYTCRYPVKGGALVVSVKQPAAGTERAWFDQQRSRYPGIATIDGLTNFGLPGASTGDGVVLFLNDGMTLTIDARQMTDHAASQRSDDAYALASVVIACWRHDSF